MRVSSIESGSPAERAGVREGDELHSVGGMPVGDALDLAVALEWTEEDPVQFAFRRGAAFLVASLPADAPDQLGMLFEQDATRVCGNSCLFCFVDQLPRGLRPSLYVKDEDYRLSFTFGNYITLTNLSESDYRRIDRLRLSPLYVSVHATEDAIRRKMLGNGSAPAILPALERLGRSGIRVHTQIVLCPGINDGDVLERTLEDLYGQGDIVESVAVVPVGLTSHRTGLEAVTSMDSRGAAEAIDTIERWQTRYLESGADRTVYGADELYLLADRPLPPHDHYGGFPQIENGVGLLRAFEADLEEAAGQVRLASGRRINVTVITGRAAGAFVEGALRSNLGSVPGLTLSVRPVANSLLGPTVTVAGLLPGRDLADAVSAEAEADLVLLPAVAFNEDGLTLDGMTLPEISDAAGRDPDSVVATDDVVSAILRFAGPERHGAGGRDR